MKLTKSDKDLLLNWGHPESDFEQIEHASKKTKYTKWSGGNKKETRITENEAIQILGRETFLSGITRSAFHWTAARKTGNEIVYFDSSKFFK